MTAHIESQKNEIAKKVLLPGDPLRAQYIAKHFLEDAKLVNQVRGMFGYTGTYKGEKVTVFATGMGMPSMGIYAYELCKFYGVETLIRIGTCGTYQEGIHIKDIILATQSYTKSNYPSLFFNDTATVFHASTQLNACIQKAAKKKNISLVEGPICTTDAFDLYVETERFLSQVPNHEQILAYEMEAAALFAIGKHLHKQTACLLTVVDSQHEKAHLSSEERQNRMDEMILLALDAIVL